MKLTKLTLAQSHDCEKDASEGVILSRLVLVLSLSLHLVLSQKDLKGSWKKKNTFHRGRRSSSHVFLLDVSGAFQPRSLFYKVH